MNAELTLRDYLDILRRRAWIVFLCLFGALILALLWSATQTPMYRSEARILINQNTSNDIFDPVTGAATNAADRQATNEVELLKSQLVQTEADARLGFEADDSMSARAEARSDVVVVNATDADPVVARNIAQTYSEAYLDVRRSEFIAERLETAEKILERVREVEAEIDAAAAGADTSRKEDLRDDLADSYDRLTITADLGNNGSARIIDDANLPEAPFSPRTNRNLALGGVLGLMLGAGVALLLESLDRSIKSRQVLEQLTPGIPALASIPAMKHEQDVISLASSDGLETEVFRTLRASIEFAAVDRPISVIQVTSAGANAGKTTVAANLAVVMAQSGHRVAIIDCDLRRPRLHTVFDIEQVPGISSIIIGRENGAESSQSMNLDNGRLWVFPSGPIPPGPSELLGSERAAQIFAGLRKSLDVIIVDSPPVLPVSDALVISRLVDATIVVVNARSTKRDSLIRALDQLDQAGAPVIGTVLNQVKANANHGYGYGYGYGYRYGQGKRAGGFFRRPSEHAPAIAGSAILDSSELPRFEVAKRRTAGVDETFRTLGTTEVVTSARASATTSNRTPRAAKPATEVAKKSRAAKRRKAPAPRADGNGAAPETRTVRESADKKSAGEKSSAEAATLAAEAGHDDDESDSDKAASTAIDIDAPNWSSQAASDVVPEELGDWSDDIEVN